MKEEINEYLSIYEMLDMWNGDIVLSDEQLIKVEIFMSENAITDHFWIKKEMENRGLEIVNRSDWGSNIVGTFINREGGTNE